MTPEQIHSSSLTPDCPTTTQLQQACAVRKAERLQEQQERIQRLHDRKIARPQRQAIKTLREKLQREAARALRLAGVSGKRVEELVNAPGSTEMAQRYLAGEELTHERLKELIQYCPDTGVFTRIEKISHNHSLGRINNKPNKTTGYISIRVFNVPYQAHNLAFFYMEGRWPKQIDHINHNKTDNRWGNLREATAQENARNQTKSKRNTSGVTGVYWNMRDEKYQAQMRIEGKYVALYWGDSFEDAIAARKAAEIEHGYHPNHGMTKLELQTQELM